jgi:uncharacterized membrane protein
MKAIFWTILVVLVVIGFAVAWRVFEYRECRKVGHSCLYCVTHIGR